MTVQRTPPVYNVTGSAPVVTATFKASGVDRTSSSDSAKIVWSQANATPGVTFLLTPATDNKSCTVTVQGTIPGYAQVDVTCTYQNYGGSPASQTVTLVWGWVDADKVSLTCSG